MRRYSDFLRAWLTLAWLQACTPLTTFSALARKLERTRTFKLPPDLTESQHRRLAELAWAVRAAARRLPWHSPCLLKALAAQRLLQQAAIPGLLVIGVRAGSHAEEEVPFGAHAWVQCGSLVLETGDDHRGYTPLSTYVWHCD